ncbi:hypothetical protein NXS19_003118 [Fusarium pseudograminearum]|nr:hypothetical protein NXS19_003118 [Fusarium pseudograminearum]
MDEKAQLPPYSSISLPAPVGQQQHRSRRALRRSRGIRLFALACLGFIAFAQWRQISPRKETTLSIQKLNENLQTCKKLRVKPEDPVGLGRDKNARYIDGGKPTLIKNATIWIGEPVEGTDQEDARSGKGWEWVQGDVFLEKGLIQRVEKDIKSASLPDNTIIYEAHGRRLTTGIVDTHSHAGVYPLPSLQGNSDGNEMSDNITPWARAIDSLLPLDPQIEVIKSGGVTTSLILPGSGNNIGGEAYLIKHAVGKPDGRKEISAQDLLADPDRNWRYMKMACGENAKNVHGRVGNRPFSRMGESYEFRHAFEQARDLIQKQDDWCAKAESHGVESLDEYLPGEIAWESLSAALRGQVHINTHCYTIPDLEAMVDHTNEFKFAVRAFHHAHQTYLVPEILKRTWGGRAPASALFADNMFYKTEAYIGSEYAGKILNENNLTVVYVSDNPVINAQHVLFEAAKAHHYGLPYHVAMASVTSAPAELLGMGKRLGKVKPGFDADVVVWDSDPLSVGATPVQVWIDGTPQFESPVELSKQEEAPVAIEKPAGIVEEPSKLDNVLFTGVTKVLLEEGKTYDSQGQPVNVVVTKGKLSCVGKCSYEFDTATATGAKTIALKNGYLTRAFTAVGGTLGLSEIEAEDVTNNGPNPLVFSRAIDGLALDSKKLNVAARYGVTRAISAPIFVGAATHFGTSVGFSTSALTTIEEGAVFAPDLAVHYTLDVNVRGTTSYSAAFGGLRNKLLAAVTSNQQPVVNPFSEEAYLKKVVNGERVLALTINSADGIATALRIKSEIESLFETSSATGEAQHLKVAIIGGAESHMVAKELGEAGVGVILAPLQSIGDSWDSRRVLTGAPLTNGTVVDALLDAGVTVAIGLHEDWELRDLGFAAGTAYKNGGGRLKEKEAVDLVSTNIYKILGADEKVTKDPGHFMVTEGSPLEIGSRLKAVGHGRDQVSVFI